jgi:hypothetical protein
MRPPGATDRAVSRLASWETSVEPGTPPRRAPDKTQVYTRQSETGNWPFCFTTPKTRARAVSSRAPGYFGRRRTGSRIVTRVFEVVRNLDFLSIPVRVRTLHPGGGTWRRRKHRIAIPFRLEKSRLRCLRQLQRCPCESPARLTSSALHAVVISPKHPICYHSPSLRCGDTLCERQSRWSCFRSKRSSHFKHENEYQFLDIVTSTEKRAACPGSWKHLPYNEGV